MDDGGISITGLTIGGAALTAIGGMVGAWIKARMGRTEITPQPLEVREVKGLVTTEACREWRDTVQACHSNLFARVSHCEQRIAAVEASLQGIQATVARMDSKLDTIIGRLA
jgi:hypothetical protein